MILYDLEISIKERDTEKTTKDKWMGSLSIFPFHDLQQARDAGVLLRKLLHLSESRAVAVGTESITLPGGKLSVQDEMPTGQQENLMRVVHDVLDKVAS